MKHLSIPTLPDRNPAPGSVIVDQVVFPAVLPGIWPRPMGSATGCALLRLTNGSVWMLRARGARWTPERLRIASSVLVAVDASKVNARVLTRELEVALGLSVAIVEAPGLEPLNPGQWDLSGNSGALVRRAEGHVRGGREHRSHLTETTSVEEGLGVSLGSAVSEFLSSLDPAARATATRGGSFSVAAYNFLVHPVHGTYRRQFAETFPCLLPHAVHRTDDGLDTELREIVDGGKPLVHSLAARWQVRPGVVRHLRGKSIDLVGEHWALRMPQLAVFLKGLIPEDMPGDEKADWDLFNKAVAIGDRKFRTRHFNNAFEYNWVRHAMRRFRGREVKKDDIEALAADFFRTLKDIILQAFKEWLAMHRPELPEQHRVAWSETQVLPDEFRALDGSRVIRPLNTDEALSEHGKAISNCLAQRAHRLRYEQRCRNGDHHILGIYDASTGEPCSTVHLTGTPRAAITVIEHTGAHNKRASDRCVAALRDLLAHLESHR